MIKTIFAVIALTMSLFAQAEVMLLDSVTIIWDNGTISSSDRGDFRVSGVANVEGTRVSGRLEICKNGTCRTVNQQSGFWVQKRSVIHWDNGSPSSAIINSEPFIMSTRSSGGVEIQKWTQADVMTRNSVGQGFTQKSAGTLTTTIDALGTL